MLIPKSLVDETFYPRLRFTKRDNRIKTSSPPFQGGVRGSILIELSFRRNEVKEDDRIEVSLFLIEVRHRRIRVSSTNHRYKIIYTPF
jgi:hypothetical protein